MHETSLRHDLVAQMVTLAKNASADRATEVTVRLGALSPMATDDFCEHFQQLASGTMGDGARVLVVHCDNTGDPNAHGIVSERIEIEAADVPLHGA